MTGRTRVLYVAPSFPNHGESAAEVRSSQLVRRLGKQVDLHVVAFRANPGTAPPDQTDQLALSSSVQVMLAQLTRPLQPRAMARFTSRHTRRALQEIAERFRPDIVHLDTFGVASHVETLRNYPLLVHVHDATSPKYQDWADASTNWLRRLDRRVQGRLARRVEQRMFPRARRVIIDSHDDLAHFSPTVDARVIALGFDDAVFTPDGPQTEHLVPTIVFSGSMDSLQSIDGAHQLVRKIMPIVWRSHPNAELHLVGSNPPDELRRLAQADTRIVLTGFVDDLARYLRSASVYVCPLRIGSGMRTRLVEALAVGCAAVSSENACRGLERPADGVPWREADAPDDIANAVCELLDDPGARRELGDRAAEYARTRYSWAATINSLVAEYDAIVGGH